MARKLKRIGHVSWDGGKPQKGTGNPDWDEPKKKTKKKKKKS